jgi:hypothetical protein
MEFLKRYWLAALAVVVIGVWYFRKRMAAPGPGTTVTGQPSYTAPSFPKMTVEPMATQGTQQLAYRETLAERNVIGRAPAPVSTSAGAMTLAPRTLMAKAAALPTSVIGTSSFANSIAQGFASPAAPRLSAPTQTPLAVAAFGFGSMLR